MKEVLLFLQTFGMTTGLPNKTVAGVKKKTVYRQGLRIPKVHDVPISQLRNLTEFPTYQLFFDKNNSLLLDQVYKCDIDLYCQVIGASTDQYWDSLRRIS